MNQEDSVNVGKVVVIMIVITMVFPASAILSTSPTFAASEDTALAAAPAPSVSHMIQLRRASFDTGYGAPSLPATMSVPNVYPDTWFQPYIVQANGPITEEWKSKILQTGAEIVGYIPDNALLVRTPRPNIGRLSAVPGTFWTGVYQPAYKIAPELDGRTGPVTIDISLFPKGTNGPTVRLLKNAPGIEFLATVNTNNANFIRVKVDASVINDIANQADVRWITEYSDSRPMNNEVVPLVQSGGAIMPIHLHGITGQNEVVTISDGEIANGHPNFSDSVYGPTGTGPKILADYVPGDSAGILGDPGNHGSHICGSVLGDGPAYGSWGASTYDGQAYMAQLVFQDIGNTAPASVYPPSDYYNDLFKYPEITYNSKIHGNAWGGGTGSGYSAECAQSDKYIWDSQDFSILFGVGGGGPTAYTLDSQAEAKNIISPGSCDKSGLSVSGFSGRGPAKDGRIKPDLIAPGENVWSCDNPTGYFAMSGASPATAAATGAAALVREYFREGWSVTGTKTAANGFSPSAALVKAALINGAVDMGAADVPNMNEGWGRVHLENSLYFSGDTRVSKYIDYGGNVPGTTAGVGLTTGDSVTYDIGVNAGQPLKITLVWSDYPGDPAAVKMLVNDLDLTVTAPGAVVYKGNVFSGGQSITGGVYDSLNNVECVYLNAPTAGAYSITIDGTNVAIGPQNFALVISGGIDPGYGMVSMDRVSYTAPDTINLRVEDPNNAAASVTVTLTSSGSADSETVTLPFSGIGTGVFTGVITTSFDVVTLGDGVLQVNDGDTVTASYSDASPVHTAMATAVIQTFGPRITNVYVDNIAGTSAMVHFITDIAGNSTVYFGTSAVSSTWVNSTGDNLYTTNHTVLLSGLSMGALYYFDVESTTVRGARIRDTNGGLHYKFSTLSAATGPVVFLLDDDSGGMAIDGTPWEQDWMNNLELYGWSYTHWDVMTQGTPTLGDLQTAKVVVWVIGESYPQLGPAERAVVGQYMDAGGRLFVAGQDIGWDMNPGGSDVDVTWYNKYLKATYNADDASGGTGIISVVGVPGDPVSAGFNLPLDSTVNGGWMYPDDISNNGGSITWTYNPSGIGNCSGVKYNETMGIDNFRVVYEAWKHEMIGAWAPPAVDIDRGSVLNQSLLWLLGADLPKVQILYPTLSIPYVGNLNIQWTSVGALDVKVFYSDNNGQAWNLLYNDPTGSATSYVWDTTTVNDGTDYRIKVLVTGTLGLTDFNTSVQFRIINAVDTLGPRVVPGSVRVSPQPTYTPGPATVTATITDIGKGGFNIIAAECYLDSTTSVPIAMTAVDGLFDSPTENVTCTVSSNIANGTHIIYVRGQDFILNWGGFESVGWVVINPSPQVYNISLANLTAPAWVLVSFPIKATGDVPTIFNDALWGDGNTTWARIMWFDNVNKAWKSYDPARPAALNDMDIVDNTLGFWIYITSNTGDFQLTVGSGAMPAAPVNITLTAGWNLVGYPSATPGQAPPGDGVAYFDALATYLITDGVPPAGYSQGNAYWVHVPVTTVWTVNP